MKSYDYINKHPEQYAEDYEKAKDAVLRQLESLHIEIPSPSVLFRMINTTFHSSLIQEKRESKPEKCSKCPIMSYDFLPSGQVGTECTLNVDQFVGDSFFGLKMTKRPTWCPLDKEK